MDDAVDHGCGHDLVSEYVTPAGEREIAGQDQRCVFVAAGDELKEQVRGVLFEWNVADLVDDDEAVTAELDQFQGESALLVGRLQPGHPIDGSSEQHPVAGMGGLDP